MATGEDSDSRNTKKSGYEIFDSNTYILIIVFSCKENNKERIVQLVNEWQGKEIRFPENPVFTRFVTDTVDFRIPQSDYKILVYVDSSGCTSCKLQLMKWKELIAYLDTVAGGAVPFLFFFQSKDEKELRNILKCDQFDLPVCVDRDDRFYELNHFPSDMTFQTFLLNKDNKVVILGNPVHNIQVKDLYLKQITGKSNLKSKMIKTVAEVVDNQIDFGTISKFEIKDTFFQIRNAGNEPLVIIDVSTSCSCTKIEYSREPVPPGGFIRVGLQETPKTGGLLNEIAIIKCNTDHPIKINIRGNVQ